MASRAPWPQADSLDRLMAEHHTTIGCMIALEVQDRHLIIVEDIVDTGTTMHHLMPTLLEKGPASVEIAALFFKPASLRHDLSVRYVAQEIPNDFVVGYGLDYDGLGRNLPDVYVAV